MNDTIPTGSVTPASSPLALGIRNFGGIHYDPSVTAPAAPAAPPAAPAVSAPPADGSVAAPPTAPPAITWETAPERLRTEYQQTKAEAERWKTLGKHEEVSQVYTTFQQKLTQAANIGKSLGYTDQQIREAMMEDPKGTLAYLQQEYAKPASATREEIDRQLQQAVDARVKPIQERFDETINREANARYEGERDRLYKTEFADGLPDENREELFEILDSLISADAAALQRLKFDNQVSDVARHMAQAKVVFMKRHNSYIAHERGRTGNPPPPNGNKKDDVNKGQPWKARKLSDGTTLGSIFGH